MDAPEQAAIPETTQTLKVPETVTAAETPDEPVTSEASGPADTAEKLPVKVARKAAAKKAPAKKAPAKKAPAKAARATVPVLPVEESPTAPDQQAALPEQPSAPEQPTAPEQPSALEQPTAPEQPTVRDEAAIQESVAPEDTATATSEAAATLEPVALEPGVVVGSVASGGVVRPPDDLVTAVRATPRFAPELLAAAAVQHLAPEAAEATAWLRATYPTATDDGLARLAARTFTRRARAVAAASALLGPFGVLGDSVLLRWSQARLVLHIAAAYRHDPADRLRIPELLVLQEVHPTLEAAERALAGTVERRSPLTRLAARALVGAAVTRIVGGLAPGSGVLLAAAAAGRSTENLAARAINYYRKLNGPGPEEPPVRD